MMLNSIFERVVAKKRRKLLGRGIGSGHGKTSSRGHKGASSRSGCKHRLMFEGGQTPLPRRVAKHGFSNTRHRTTLTAVSIEKADRFCSGLNSKSLKRKCGHKIICSNSSNRIDSHTDYSAKKISKKAFELFSRNNASLKFTD